MRSLLVSLPTLSNQDRQLNKEAALSAHYHTESRILPQGKLQIPALLVKAYSAKQAKRRKMLEEKKEAKRAALPKERSRASGVT